MHICIFEDEFADNFYPLSVSRPVYDLFYGMSTLREKIIRYFRDAKCSLLCRGYLKETVTQNNPGIEVNELKEDNYLFINGRILIDEFFFETLSKNSSEKVFKKDNVLLAARISSGTMSKIKDRVTDSIYFSLFDGIPVENVEVETVDFIWELIKNNGAKLREDFKHLNFAGISEEARVFRDVHLVNIDDITIEAGSTIKPGVVIDASKGPVYIGREVEIYPNSVIEGPVSIGDRSIIKSCAVITDNVTIGKVCKVGGEVEESVIMPFTNKQHAGYLGHSYLGSWINIGANTNCSDLKDNYSLVKIKRSGKLLETGLQFLGLMMGDHSKSGINSMFNTGTIVGFSCNIFGSGFLDKFIGSFSWGGKDNMETYDVGKSIETARKVMRRRNIEMTKADENLFDSIFKLTEKER